MILIISRVFYAIFCGIFFALLQIGYFFLLETFLSSAYITYFTIVLGWLCGSWLGLRITLKDKEMIFALLSLGSIYLAYLLTQRFSFGMHLLLLYIFLVMVSSLYSGYFFKAQRRTFAQVKYLFFWENVGFIFGLVFSYLSFILFGVRLIIYGPILIFSIVWASFYFRNACQRRVWTYK